MSFKGIEVGINQKPVCNCLLVINSNWHPIWYCFGVIAANCSNFGQFAFLSHPLGSLVTTYDVHLGLIGKPIGLPISVKWTYFTKCYGWGATGENTLKIGDFAPTQSILPKSSGRRGRPSPLTHGLLDQWMLYNFVAESFHFSHK